MRIHTTLLALALASIAGSWASGSPHAEDQSPATHSGHAESIVPESAAQPLDLGRFDGSVAVAKPLPPLPMPRHPYQDNRGYAGAHGDSYNSGVLAAAGPLGKELKIAAFRTEHAPAFCSTQHFDHKGRIITVCVGRNKPTKLLLLDPESFEVLAEHRLPPMAGFYFRMDQQGRVVVPAGDMTVQTFEVEEKGNGLAWRMVERRDVSAAVPTGQRDPLTVPLDIVADWEGNWWFSVIAPAAVGYITPEGEVHSYLFEGEKIQNGFASSPDGVFFVTDKNMYAMRASAGGPEAFMRFPYETGEAVDSLSTGSGTTPVLFGNKLIAFGDNADPRPHVLVYRLDQVPDGKRLVCKVPVFKPGRSVLENSFIGYDHSLVIENNKGFTMGGDSSRAEPGFVRIDVRRDLSGCDVVWENYEVRAGTGAKLSLGTGLIYVHELLQGTREDWYVTAIDFETGKRVWRHYLGSGLNWDNALLTMSISPDGLLTSGMYKGLLGAKDAE